MGFRENTITCVKKMSWKSGYCQDFTIFNMNFHRIRFNG